MAKCSMKTEVYSRVCGYHRPVQAWNGGKKAEFEDRKAYALPSVLPPRRREAAEFPAQEEEVSIAV